MKSFLFCFIFIFGHSACFAQNVWSGKKEKWTKGIGTIFDPFLIETAENLAYLGENNTSEGKYFLVVNDIHLGGKEWTPICAFPDSPFKGNIDFGNHTIYGLNVLTERSAGLFGYIENARVINLVFDKTCTIKGYNLAGMLAGNTVSSEIDNIINNGNVFSDGYLSSTGGIIGKDNNSTITNAMNNGEVENEDKSSGSTDPVVYVGGILGNGVNTTIQQCCNTGYIHGYSVMATAIYSVGGIVGNCDGNISYCYNTGKCMSRLRYVRWYNDGTRAYVSGIRGGQSDAIVNNCYSTGEISGCSYWSGRYSCILCYSGSSSNCYGTWDITGCQASSYTASTEMENGVKVSLDELNSAYIVSKLDEGTGIFIKDEYPYVNNAAPVFSTIKQISIKTEDANEIKANSAVLNGAFFAPGYQIKRKGFLIKAKGVVKYDTLFTNTSYRVVDNLKPEKRYVYSFFVETEDSKCFVGQEVEFVTSSIKSEIYTLEFSNLTSNGVELKGAVILNNSETLEGYGFYCQEEGSNEIATINAVSFDGIYFTAPIQNLKASTKYSYWSYASFDIGEIYGDIRQFTTKESLNAIENIQIEGIDIKTNKGCLEIVNPKSKEILLLIYSIEGKIVKSIKMGKGVKFINLEKGIYIIGRKKVLVK